MARAKTSGKSGDDHRAASQRLKHDFSGYKQNHVRRIQRRLQYTDRGRCRLAEYLRREPSEGDALFRELLIESRSFSR